MDKIYSRNRRINLPKFNGSNLPYNRKNYNYNNGLKKLGNSKGGKIALVIIIAIISAKFIVKSISPIIDKQCMNMAKSIATKVSNEQATFVMSKYKYDDLCLITKDTNRKYCND